MTPVVLADSGPQIRVRRGRFGGGRRGLGCISALFDPALTTVRFGEESPWRAEPPPRSLEPPQLAQECPGTSQTPARRLEAAPVIAVSHLRDPPPSPSHPISTAHPTVRCLRAMALFASLCSFDHPDPLPTLSPRTILMHLLRACAGFRRGIRMGMRPPTPFPPNTMIRRTTP